MKRPIEKRIVFLRRRQVEKRTGLGRSSLYKLISDGLFPKPVKLGPRTAAWVESEVDAWAAERVARRDAEQVSA